MSKKKPLSPELAAECQALNRIFLAKKNELKLSQKKIADAAGISPAALSFYLNGTNPLNAKIAALMAKMLKVDVSSFSPRLAQEIRQMTSASSELALNVAKDFLQAERVIQETADTSHAAHEASEVINALYMIMLQTVLGGLHTEHFKALLKIRNEIVHGVKLRSKEDQVDAQVPERLRELAYAAISVAEAGENPDDMISMINHGLKRSQSKEAVGRGDVKAKSRAK